MVGLILALVRFDPAHLALILAADLPPWANYGVLGVIIVALLSGNSRFGLVPGYQHAKVELENVALKADVKLLTEKVLSLSESALPALNASTTVINQAIEEIRLIRQRRR